MLNLLTITNGRPEAFRLAEQWMMSQDFDGDLNWTVVNDSAEDYQYRLGQEVIRRPPAAPGPASFKANLLAGIEAAPDDEMLLFIEDDDWYSPKYLSFMQAMLAEIPMAGIAPIVYYNLEQRRCWPRNNTRSASLCMTGVMMSDPMRGALERAITRQNTVLVDLTIWGTRYPRLKWKGEKLLMSHPYLHVGMKGLPGAPGLTRGHRMPAPDKNGVKQDDADLTMLGSLMGPFRDEPLKLYRQLRKDHGWM